MRLRVEQTEEFVTWVKQLDDLRVVAAISDRVDRLKLGLLGDVSPVGDGVSELRIHLGSGWRIYYVRTGDAYIMLTGGSKRTQARDVKRAKLLAGGL